MTSFRSPLAQKPRGSCRAFTKYREFGATYEEIRENKAWTEKTQLRSSYTRFPSRAITHDTCATNAP